MYSFKRPYSQFYPSPQSAPRQTRQRRGSYSGYVGPSMPIGSMVTRAPKLRISKKNFASKVRKLESASHFVNSDAAVAFVHNVPRSMCPTSNIAQGLGETQRTGDEVYLESLVLRGHVSAAAATGAYMYRLIVGYSTSQNVSSTLTTGGLVYSDIFLANSGSYNTNGIVDPKAFTCLYDNTILVNSLISNSTDNALIAQTIPLKTNFPYKSANGSLGKFKNLYVFVVATVQGGTNAVTSCGSVSLGFDLIFKQV